MKLDPAKTDSRKSEPARFAPSNLDEPKSVLLSISFVFEQPDQSMFTPARLEHEAVADTIAPGASSSTTESTPTFGVKREGMVFPMFKHSGSHDHTIQRTIIQSNTIPVNAR